MSSIRLSEAKNRLQRLTLQLLQGEVERIITTDPEIIQEKVDEFRAGELPDGSPIGQYRNENYRLFKIQKNPLAGGNVDLILTGAFTERLFPERLSKNRYKFNSTDSKTADLKAKYGENIMGLNEKTFLDIQKTKYAPLLIRRIKQITNL